MKTKKRNYTLTELKSLRFLGITALIAVIAIGIVAAVSAQIGPVKKDTEQEKRKSVADKTDKNSKSVTQKNQTDGQIRPLTAQEAKELADGIKELVNQSSDGLVSVQNADGSVSIDLQGRFQNIAVAKKNSDDTVEQSCLDNTKSAASFFGIDPKRFGDKSKNAVKRPVVEKDENGLETK